MCSASRASGHTIVASLAWPGTVQRRCALKWQGFTRPGSDRACVLKVITSPFRNEGVDMSQPLHMVTTSRRQSFQHDSRRAMRLEALVCLTLVNVQPKPRLFLTNLVGVCDMYNTAWRQKGTRQPRVCRA